MAKVIAPTTIPLAPPGVWVGLCRAPEKYKDQCAFWSVIPESQSIVTFVEAPIFVFQIAEGVEDYEVMSVNY